ncbi:MAG: indole-3-glycerol-phosphate synthase [Actinobacteria bacterium]|nr:indole-3-glycerol-phosphate synthase [Actinomycetota bacterium]
MKFIKEILANKKKNMKDLMYAEGGQSYHEFISSGSLHNTQKGSRSHYHGGSELYSELHKDTERDTERHLPLNSRHAARDKDVSFIKNIKNGRVNIIAEIKKASPSRGWINRGLDVGGAAATYDRYGDFICGISVLTESLYFKGCPEDLAIARSSSALPVLRKDFIFDLRQVYESAALGADCILLICSILGYKKLKILYDAAMALGMDVLVEIHNIREFEKALALDAGLIGINNRDLIKMEVRSGNIIKILDRVDRNDLEGRILVCESGVSGVDYIEELYRREVNTFLIGSYFMESPDLAIALETFRNSLVKKNLIPKFYGEAG